MTPIQGIPRSGWLFGVAIVAAALSLIEILDIVQLPFESAIGNGSSPIFGGFVSLVLTGGYLGLFALMLLESMALPIPSEVFLPLAGYLIFIGRMTFPGALVVSTIAALIGSLAAYFLSLGLGRPLVYRLAGRLGVSQASLVRSEAWLSGKGSLVILVSRVVPGIRSSISFPAGALKMDLVRFSIMTTVGCFAWSAILIYIGYSTGRFWRANVVTLTNFLMQATIYAVAGLSSFYVGYFLFSRKRGAGTAMPSASQI